MAIPTMTNNSPQAGYIAWGAFTIQLNGVAYGVPAASSNQRWVWWEYRNGTPVINAGPAVPDTLTDDDLVLFANKNGIGVRVQSTNFVDGELLVDGSIFAEALSANLINSNHIVTAGLDAGVIKFGTMHGDRIEARTIQSDRVIVGGGDNRLLSDAMEQYVQSRGFNLVTNGTGLLGTNENFSNYDFVSTDAPTGAKGSFLQKLGGYRSIGADELIPVDPERVYELTFSHRQVEGDPHRFYAYLHPHDAYGHAIAPYHYMEQANTRTTLAVALNPGDTTITLASSANWRNSAGTSTHLRSIIFWDYVDQGGKAWAPGTYSRNWSGSDYYADGAISGNVITLRAPYSGPARAVGTPVGNGSSGGSFMYLVSNQLATVDWKQWSGRTAKGVHTNLATSASTQLPIPTANVKVGYLMSYQTATGTTASSGSKQAIANVSLQEVTLAADAYSRWAPVGQTTIDGGLLTTNTVVGNKIMGQTIGAEKLIVGDLANMAEINESYALGTVFDHTHTIASGWSTRGTNTSQYFMFRNNHGPLSFKTGDRIRVAFDVYADAAVSPTLYLWTYGSANATQSLGGVAITTAVKTITLEADVTVDTNGKTTFMIGLQGVSGRNVFLRNVRAYRMGAGELIVDGTIVGKKMVANSITARELTVGTLGDELLLNGGFEDDENWSRGANASRVAAAARSGLWGHRLTASGSVALVGVMPFPVSAGQILATTIWARGIVANTGLYFRLQWLNSSGVQISTADAISNINVPLNVWTEYSQKSPVAPTGAVRANLQIFNTSGTVDIDDLSIRVQVISAQIKDGAIITDKLDANAVTAAKVAADVMVVNEIFGRDGYFGNLTADQMRSGSLDADVAVLGSLGVGDISITPEIGIVVPSPKGDTILRSDGTGSTFAGQVETDDLTVDGGLTVNGKTNNINGSLGLANVVVPPTVAPTVARAWPYTKPIGADTFHIAEGLDLTSWVAVHWNSKTVKKYDKVTGALQATWDAPADYDIYSVTSVGSYYFMACRKISTSEVWLCRMTSTGGSFTALAKIDNLDDVSGWMCGVGRDEISGNVMTAHVLDTGTPNAGKIRVFTWSTAGAQLTSELYDGTSDGVKAGDWCYGVGRGYWGANGEDQVYINTNYRVRFYDRTSKLYLWWPGTAESPKGQTVTSTGKFVYVGFSTYRVYEWATKNGFNFEDPSITYAWYDSKSAGTGTHETTPSPAKVLTDIWPWSWIEVQTPAPSNTGQDDSPDSVAIYIDNKRQPDLGPGVTKAMFRTITAGVAAKTTNEFAALGVASYPGEIFSAATKPDGTTPRLLMKGDGTGHWGDLVVDGQGRAIIGGDTGWIEVTAFTNLWENYGAPWRTVGYRKIGKTVYLKGLIRTPAGTLAVPASPFTLPVGFRPPGDMIVQATFEKIQKNIDATGDGSKNTGTPNNSTTSHTHPISAYDISSNVLLQNPSGRFDILTTGEVRLVNPDFANAAWISFEGISFLID